MKDENKNKLVPIIECRKVEKYYPVYEGLLNRVVGVKRVVDDVDMSLYAGKTVVLVGESGCGKSVLLRTILDIEPGTGGEILYKGISYSKMDKQQKKEMHSSIGMIFQDTISALHPRMTIKQSLEEPLILNGINDEKERLKKIVKTINLVGLDEGYLTRYPHQLSGGQLQRVAIARALVINPKLLLADEPISALDVSLQAQILNLLMDLQEKLNLSMLFVAHDLAVVRQLADEIHIMYLGNVVEYGTSKQIYKNALHPYTKVLIKAAPSIKKGINDEPFSLDLKVGDTPDYVNPPKGCVFCTRCTKATHRCMLYKPEAVEVEPGHMVKCFRVYPDFEEEVNLYEE